MTNWCIRCGAPAGPYVQTAGGCRHCHFGSFAFDAVIRLGLYDGLLRRACLRSKEPWNDTLAATLAELLWQHEQQRFREFDIDVALPIPQYWVQRCLRSHNPAEIVADVIARRLNVPADTGTLVKSRYTLSQKRLPVTRRRLNLRNVFRVTDAGFVRDATILLVDDILTTGTTANEAAGVLRRAGASRVVVAVLGRVLVD